MAERALNRDRERPPLLSPHSKGRRGPDRRDRFFSQSEIAQIRRTVSRMPEVMVKVTGGGTSRTAVAAHFRYITRDGEVRGETDQGDDLQSPAERSAFLRELQLDLSRGQHRSVDIWDEPWERKKPPKLVYHVVLGMPAPTAPEAVLEGARHFARENFALKHRYALVLHTDQSHPHVHIVVKAEDDTGRRLRIDKAKLRDWRAQFAQAVRDQGIAANASSRFERGRIGRRRPDGMYRAQRYKRSGASQRRVRSVAAELVKNQGVSDPVRPRLERTRDALRQRWEDIARHLETQGEIVLASDVRYFAANLPRVITDREAIAEQLIDLARAKRAEEAQAAAPLERSRERARDLDYTR